MDRERWQRWVPYLTWPCPACQNGHLRLISDTFREAPSRSERLEQDAPSANHNERLWRFVGLLKCDFRSCGETATVAGNHLTEWYQDGSEDGITQESYEVFSLVPSPLPFKIPRSVCRDLSNWSSGKRARCSGLITRLRRTALAKQSRPS
jgi:hypothetical protein